MPCRPKSIFLALCVATAFGCVTEYQPSESPLDEASLADAIRTVEESEAAIELHEGGLQITAYLYQWREPLQPSLFRDDAFGHRAFDPPSRQRMRLLSGPAREVYLPYDRIEKVEARSWPLWTGVEIGIGSAPDLAVEGPLVIQAGSQDEARRLTDAIETIRRARMLSAAIDPAPPLPSE